MTMSKHGSTSNNRYKSISRANPSPQFLAKIVGSLSSSEAKVLQLFEQLECVFCRNHDEQPPTPNSRGDRLGGGRGDDLWSVVDHRP